MTPDGHRRGPSRPGRYNRRAQRGRRSAAIRLDSAKAGTRLYHVTPEQVRAPFDIEVEQVIPSTLAGFERSHSKSVPIVPAIDGDPRTGFVVGTITADPPTVIVVGPRATSGVRPKPPPSPSRCWAPTRQSKRTSPWV